VEGRVEVECVEKWMSQHHYQRMNRAKTQPQFYLREAGEKRELFCFIFSPLENNCINDAFTSNVVTMKQEQLPSYEAVR